MPNPFEKINPMKNSPVPENLKLEKKQGEDIDYYYWDAKNEKSIFGDTSKVKLNILKEKNTDEEFIEKRIDLNPERQIPGVEYLISLLIKGVLHSSDFIKKEDKFFSRKMNLDNTEKAKEGEVEAEIFLLRYLFGDWDKNIPDRNVVIDNKGKFAHYDYGESFRKTQNEKMFSFNKNRNQLEEKVKREVKLISKYGEPWSFDRSIANFLTILGLPIRSRMKEAEIELKIKGEEILNRLQDDTFWNAIAKKSEINMMNDRFNFLQQKEPDARLEELRQAMIQRLNLLISTLKERKI